MLAATHLAWGTLAALALFILASMWIGVLANRAIREGAFLKGFFLGNRGLGSWALALTATVQSGGTFMGFPSLVYTHGWAVALWIAGYMVVPITGFGILGKRLAQVSRRAGAITVPDLFRERFGSATLGLVASLFILFYMSFMMVAQFKAGALVMKISWLGSGNLSEDQNVGRFRITDEALARLDAEHVPATVIDRLRPLVGRTYSTDTKFVSEIDEAIHAAKPRIDDAGVKTLQAKIAAATELPDWPYIVGLSIFTVSVVGYTLIGGFLAAVWTDLFQSVMMWFGVVVLLILSLSAVAELQRSEAAAPGHNAAVAAMNPLEYASRKAVKETSPAFAFCPGYDPKHEGREFLPYGLALSFFCIWVLTGIGSPAGVVRIMACRNTTNIRRSIYLLGGYNAFIYIPLVIICICGRALIPHLPVGRTDEIIPQLAMSVTSELPLGQFIAGLILAAPFGAVMATVSCYLVVIASGLVRDVYQRFLRPEASQMELERLSYTVMVLVGAIAVLANIKPVAYLQAIVVFSGTGTAATFVVPVVMLAYWRRTTVPGMLAAMLSGTSTLLLLYGLGFEGYGTSLIGQTTSFRPYFLLGLDPLIWGLGASLVAGIVVSLATRPCDDKLLARYFEADERKTAVIPAMAES